MRKMIVTGGAGFIGSNFVKMILKRKSNSQVIVLDKLTYAGNIENLKGYMSDPGLDFVRGDIGNGQLLDLLLQLAQRLGQRDAIHLGHAQIGENQVKGRPARFFDGLLTIGGGFHLALGA